ncbi:MAG: hypothetical protein JKY65_24165 [Planctomycetes bacterium]|nr:hypothetical protein [Planctomycetota bacterium]
MADDKKKGCSAGRCCCLFLLLLLLSAVGTVGYVSVSFKSMRQDTPLPFAAIKRSPLEEGMLAAKFKLNEIPSGVLGGDTTVSLGERELNTLLFAQAEHTDDGKKARILLEKDSMWLEVVEPLEDGEGYLNVRLHVSLVLRQGSPPRLKLHGGTIGGFELGALSRPFLEGVVEAALVEATKQESRITGAIGFEVKDSRVLLTYPPKALEDAQKSR